MRSLFLVSLLGAWLSIPAHGLPVRTSHVSAELVLENKNLVAGSEDNFVALKLVMQPHWHTYWRYPGDSGLPTEVSWKLPEGWKAGEALWPHPKRIYLPPLVNFGYEGEALIAFPIALPKEIKEGSYTIHASASWLVCKEECIPEKAELDLSVKVSRGNALPGPEHAKFKKLQKEKPQPLPSSVEVTAVEKGKIFGVVVEGLGEGPSKLDFLPLASGVVKGTEPLEIERHKTKRTIWLEKAEPFDSQLLTLPGLLLVEGQAFDLKVPLTPGTPTAPAGAPAAPSAQPATAVAEAPAGVLLSLLFAFLGGLVLNLMPCVFPVLGIKVMSLVRQGGKHKNHTRAHGNAYAAGVIVSFLALGAVLLALRSAGEAAGWGFQLQHPGFVTLLVLLFSFVTADLAGFVNWTGRWMGAGSSLANRDGWSGSFFTGMLAVLVATPCTAPFMGTAMGAVISSPAPVVLAVFASLGLGLAVPFLFLCYQPALVSRLPKPGLWMERLKEFFALPMAATVLWLLWVLSLQIGSDGVLKIQLSLLLLASTLWAGQRFTSAKGRAFTVLCLAVSLILAFSGARSPRAQAGAVGEGWQAFSQEALAAAVKAGKPVFVDFTAAWCLTCQINKKLVLDRSAMRSYFHERGVVLLLADWTNRDSSITRTLESHGRIGVPLYLAYRPGVEKPEVLPQILTEEGLRSAFP